MSERTIGIAIPVYNRFELLFKSFEKVLANDSVAEITIVDDASHVDIYDKIVEKAKENEKIKVFRNVTNRDCYYNKYTAIAYSNQEWNILLDSDNVIDFNYLFKIFQTQDWQENTAYLPSFAAPHFDYRKYEGIEITSHNVAEFMGDSTFQTMLNTHNHFVNKKFYMKVWDAETNPNTSDSIYMNYLWLKNGGKLFVVPGLTYEHRVDNHGDEQRGHYQCNHLKTGNFHYEVLEKLRQLK